LYYAGFRVETSRINALRCPTSRFYFQILALILPFCCRKQALRKVLAAVKRLSVLFGFLVGSKKYRRAAGGSK
jgi:hypothetical protein